jgi:hypothetical protein
LDCRKTDKAQLYKNNATIAAAARWPLQGCHVRHAGAAAPSGREAWQMRDTHTLTSHRDIQNWVTQHRGMPAISRAPDRLGSMRARLALNFERMRARPSTQTSVDDGISPCSWNAWLAELDRQQLALRVLPGERPNYEFVARGGLN